MAKTPENSTSAAEVPSVPVPAMSAQDLIGLLTAAIKQSNESQQASLLAAMAELKKPYENPTEKALEEQMRKQTRDFIAKREARIRMDQDSCPHFQGSHPLSERQGDMDCIVRHRLDDNRVIGICTNCQRIFQPGDADYAQQMRRKSGNRMSKAGDRYSVQLS